MVCLKLLDKQKERNNKNKGWNQSNRNNNHKKPIQRINKAKSWFLKK
jgi:hypothetical protein